MRKVLLFIATVTALCCNAQVACQPGQLSTLVSDNTITTLTITGQMDARDFKFIATELNNLESVDMSEVEIVAYEDLANSTLGNEHTFAAATVPTLSFAGKKALTTVVLPNSATAIGQAALAACPALTQVTMGTALTTIGDYAFNACTSLQSVNIPSSVSTVGVGSFSRCPALTSVNVTTCDTPAEALTIGDEAFMDCPALSNVNLGENVTSLGNAAFAGTGLTVIDLSQYKKLQTLGNWLYAMSKVTSATLPSSLTAMGMGAFVYSDNLTTAVLPKGLEMLGDYTFAGNSALTSIDLGNVKTIGNYALYATSALQEVTIPERTTFLGTRAMAGMTALAQLNATPTSVPALGENVWEGVDQPNVKLAVTPATIDAYAAAEQWKEFLMGYNLLLGDADEDLVLSVGDINLMINVVLGRTDKYPKQTDTNEDGTISIEDINFVINAMMGRVPYSYIFVTPNTTDEVSIKNFSITPGETRDIEVVLDNAEACSHMQCDINLPEGLTIVGAETAERAQSHTLLTNVQDGNCRLICYSPKGTHITGNQGAVITLKVKADETLQSEATIVVDNVVLADESHPTLYAAPTTTEVSNTTGIDDVVASGKAYATGSTLVIEAQENCTAQVVAMNGTALTVNVAAGRNEYQPGTGFYVVRMGGKSYKVAVK